MERKELIEELANLELKKRFIKRKLDANYYNYKKRTNCFNEIKKCDKAIKEVKFKLQLLKEMKDSEI